MTSRERLRAALRGEETDRVPLTTWCFGFPAPPGKKWTTNDREVPFWYSRRLEHLHTLPRPWTIEDEFRRAAAWREIGIDDWLEISVPWGVDGAVTFEETVLPPGSEGGDQRYPVRVRTYETPSGPLRHAVRITEPEGAGWPLQPPHVPLIEDYNIPRAVEHAVVRPEDIPALRHLYCPPSDQDRSSLEKNLNATTEFAGRNGFPVQVWSAFGIDAAVWFCGPEGAILMAMDEPDAFGQLIDTIAATDRVRTELAVSHPGVDLVVQRGWYSSTDFWSPALFDAFVIPHVRELAELAHRHGKGFGYVMTTGVETLGRSLAEAGVDWLYFVDPVQDGFDVERARDLLGGRLTLVGGTNALSLASNDPDRIRTEVHRALDALAETNRFVLHPVDAIFPDTPWSGVECMIAAWREWHNH